MKSVLSRTGSGSISLQTLPKVSAPVRESVGGVFSGEKKRGCASPRVSLHFEVNRRTIRRASSEPDMIRSAIEGYGVTRTTLSKLGSTSSPAIIPEEEFETEQNETEILPSIGSLNLTEDCRSYAGDLLHGGIPLDELEFPGGGIGKNRKFPGGGSGRGEFNAGSFADPRKIRTHYEEMIVSDPTNSLLLRNYGKYLHEVERDFVRAEEYYGRAILASPGDGELLSLYGKLIWESQRDESRAKSYFDQAVLASPNDCSVLGSYAHFMWESEEDDEDVERESVAVGAAMVAAA